MQHAAISRAEKDEWLSELMQTYGDDILRLCYVILQDRTLAEDASQEVFLKAYKRLHTLRQREYAKTWLVSIAVNTCRDQLRASWLRHTDRSVSLDNLPPAACEFDERDDSVLREVMALEPKYREVLLLHYYQNMNAAECAHALHMTTSGFYRRLKRRRRASSRSWKGGVLMNDNPIRRAVDTRLSGLAFTPQMQADTLRRARLCNQTPHMRRKLSYSLAFALLALLLTATAGAAAYFGVLRFHAEQESNAAYQQHILPIGERLTAQSATVTVNDAVFDGSSLSFSLDIAHIAGTPEVYLYPRVTAMPGRAGHPDRRHGLSAGFGG